MTDLLSDEYVPPRDDWMGRGGKPIYWPQNARWPGWQKNTNFQWLTNGLKGSSMRIVWVGPNGKWWDLAGAFRGKQGVAMVNELTGTGLTPFEHKYSEGPYLPGAEIDRTDDKKRLVSFGVIINPNNNIVRPKAYNGLSYYALEHDWWNSFSKRDYGFLGFYTRTTGWRWLKCVLETTPNDTLSLDPTAFGNNSAKYNMSLVAIDPYFYKRPFAKTWINPATGHKDADGFGTGFITLANRGTIASPPQYIVTCPGTAKIGDGPDRLIEMPESGEADKWYLVDTSENALTIQGSTDPVDNAFYRFIRQAGLLNYFLHDLADQGLPLWRRWDDPQMFEFAVGPEQSATVKVQHNYPLGQITMIVPQRFDSAWG